LTSGHDLDDAGPLPIVRHSCRLARSGAVRHRRGGRGPCLRAVA
jgi:hypothetical protein